MTIKISVGPQLDYDVALNGYDSHSYHDRFDNHHPYHGYDRGPIQARNHACFEQALDSSTSRSK